jgi:DNA-binding Xre family transcriptional regulator
MAKAKMNEADELRMRIKRSIERNDAWAETDEGQEFDFRLNFANRLAAQMKAKKMTQADLCAAIDMKQPQLSKIMAGGENLTFGTVLRLARGLGVSPYALVQKHRPRKTAATAGE